MNIIAILYLLSSRLLHVIADIPSIWLPLTIIGIGPDEFSLLIREQTP
jgi:hypothetical protein